MSESPVRYFVFDVESVADGQLVSQLRYPGQGLPAEEAVDRFRAELLETRGTDFIPYTYQVPVSVAVAKVLEDFSLADLVVLDQPRYRPHIITDLFWRGWEAYRRPILVTYNGRTFDLPLLELAAFRFGLGLPKWFDTAGGRSYQQPRNRYNAASHLDLMDLMTNFGASRFSGGLNLAAHLLGKPGKMAVEGQMVQDLYHDGRVGEINDYCRCDVLDTYFVFLRTRVVVGQLTLEREQELVATAKRWVEERAPEQPAYRTYLEHWGDWPNPWEGDVPAQG
ncbi:MAG: 3'-5' exonuclease [Deferrisomatales bacterium]|nr:3'-5' exonuclease [Deferrisomatales bacterium]